MRSTDLRDADVRPCLRAGRRSLAAADRALDQQRRNQAHRAGVGRHSRHIETEVSFPIGVIDDTLLSGTQVVTVTATVVGGESTSVDVTVHDVETVSVEFDNCQPARAIR